MSFLDFSSSLVLRMSGICSNATHLYTLKCFTTDFFPLKLLNLASGVESCTFTGPFVYRYLAVFHASPHNLYSRFTPWRRNLVFSARVQFILSASPLD